MKLSVTPSQENVYAYQDGLARNVKKYARKVDLARTVWNSVCVKTAPTAILGMGSAHVKLVSLASYVTEHVHLVAGVMVALRNVIATTVRNVTTKLENVYVHQDGKAFPVKINAQTKPMVPDV